MVDWLHFILSPLAFTVPYLRALVYPLIVLNVILWTGPLAIRTAFRGAPTKGWPNAQFAIPLLTLQLAVLGFQNGYLFEGVAEEEHGRNAVNLFLIALSELGFLVIWWQRVRDADAVFGEKHFVLRVIERLRGKRRA